MSMKEIAARAEVSVSTVSLVLAGKGRISQEVRERVLQAAREINYKSPLYAQSQQNIAILYPVDTAWAHALAFINPLIQRLEERLTAAGFVPVLVPLNFGEEIAVIQQKITAVNACGVCSVHYVSVELFAELENRQVPVVIINQSSLQGQFSTVCVDDFQGAYEAGKYLLSRRTEGSMLYCGYDRDNIAGRIDDRLYGWQKALLEGGKEALKREFYAGNEIARELHEYFAALKQRHDLPGAIFAYDDFLAGFIYAELAGLGIRSGKEVLLLAPGDTLNYNLSFMPQISTMQIATAKLGEYGAGLILERVTGKISETNQVIKVRQNLVVRETA